MTDDKPADVIPPLEFQWREVYDDDGEPQAAMIPVSRHTERAIKIFVPNQVYVLTAIEERSYASHAHQFAWLHEKWRDLPEVLKTRFPTSEHLRKHALIMSGFRNERAYVCSSIAEARRMAAFLGNMEEHSIVSIRGDVVLYWTAQSQSYPAMGKAAFQRAKSAVLQYTDDLISGEITPEQEVLHRDE